MSPRANEMLAAATAPWNEKWAVTKISNGEIVIVAPTESYCNDYASTANEKAGKAIYKVAPHTEARAQRQMGRPAKLTQALDLDYELSEREMREESERLEEEFRSIVMQQTQQLFQEEQIHIPFNLPPKKSSKIKVKEYLDKLNAPAKVGA